MLTSHLIPSITSLTRIADFLHIVTALGHVTWSRALARASIGGVEWQNPSICTNRSFVNNLFFP